MRNLKSQAITRVYRLLAARRAGDISREQKAYDALRKWCATHELDLGNVIDGATKQIAEKNPIATKFNGL